MIQKKVIINKVPEPVLIQIFFSNKNKTNIFIFLIGLLKLKRHCITGMTQICIITNLKITARLSEE